MGKFRTLSDVTKVYPTEAACLQVITELRWPNGFRCPRCDHEQAYSLKERRLLECRLCGHQVSVTAGTAFHLTRTDLQKWFFALWLLGHDRLDLSVVELSIRIEVSPNTAWTIRKKVRREVQGPTESSLLRQLLEAMRTQKMEPNS